MKKRTSNLEKHGIDFEDAKIIFEEPYRIEGSANRDEENRSFVIGDVCGNILLVAYVYRDGDVIRIISARRLVEMKDKHTTKFKGKSDWNKVTCLTEGEIESAAASDPDAPLLTKKELSGFKRVNPNVEFDVGFIRNRLHMSQEEFASSYGINKRTLEGWEQHRKKPSQTETTFLKVIEMHAEEIKKMVLEVQEKTTQIEPPFASIL